MKQIRVLINYFMAQWPGLSTDNFQLNNRKLLFLEA